MCVYIIYYISFFVYNEGSSKSCLSSLTLKGGSTAFPKPLFSWRRLAALGNLKVNFHCAHWHSFFPLKKGLSKTHQSSLTLKGGSTAFPKPLSPQGTGDVPTALLGAQTATL